MFYFTKNAKAKVTECFKTLDPVIENGRIIFKERTEDLNKGLTYEDFSLRSLMDADAIDLLLPTAPIGRSLLDSADIANIAANNIGDFADSVSVEPSKEDKDK